ncbi:MAG: tetratricopeptide repeat protein [Lewinellaceae bacterium]|nr:tetratricopeptide repeat protein [Lewinellaceae bacterium]
MKKLLLKISSVFILLLLFGRLSANNPDSLKRVLAIVQGAERLPILLQLCDTQFKGQLTNTEARGFAEEIIQRASAARDTAANVEGCLCIAINQDKSSNASDTRKWLAEALTLAGKYPGLQAKTLYKWADYYYELGQMDSSLVYLTKALQISQLHRFSTEQVMILSRMAKIYGNLGNAALADSLGRRSFFYCHNIQDSAMAYSRWAIVQEDLGHPEEALRAFLAAYRINKKLKNNILASFNLQQAASILRDEGQYEQAIGYLEESIQLSQSIGNLTGLSSAYHSLGTLHMAQKSYDKALAYFRMALSMKKDIGSPKKVLNTIVNMANLYVQTAQYDSCLALCKYYLPLSHKIEHKIAASNLAFLGSISAAKTGRMALARQYLASGEQVISRMKVRQEMPEVYQLAAKSHATLGYFEKAYQYQALFQALQDSIFNAEKSRIISEMETRFETEKKEQQISVLGKENELNNARIANARTRQFALLICLALLGAFAYFLWQNAAGRKRLNTALEKTNSELTRKNTEVQTLLREIHHRVKNNLQIISSLLRMQARRTSDENTLEALRTGQARIRSMALLHQRLYQGEQLKDIPMSPYLTELSQSLLDAYRVDEDRIRFRTEIEPIDLDVDTAIPLGLIANELMTNALKYAFPEDRSGEILLSLKKTDHGFALQVSDNGIGMKLSEGKPAAGRNTYGLELVESLAQKLNGQLVFSNGKGTRTTLTAPIFLQPVVTPA